MASRFFLVFLGCVIAACASPDPRPPELGSCTDCAMGAGGGSSGGGGNGGARPPGDQSGGGGGQDEDENANPPDFDGGAGNVGREGGSQVGVGDDDGGFIPLGGGQLQGG
jgi:hypothetical protein